MFLMGAYARPVYDRSAQIYDLLYVGSGIKDYGAEAVELNRIVQDACPTAQTLLDVACGTGAHLVELRRWYTVEGIDLSPAMLAVARSRLGDVPLQVADMRTLNLGKTFDAVICLFSSIGYVTDPAEMHSTVGRLAAHVGPGGVLILDGWIRPEDWHGDYRGQPDIASDDDVMVVRLAFSRLAGNITELDMHHLVHTKAGIEYFSEAHRLALTPTADYVSAVESAGLTARVMRDYMPGRDRVVGTRPSRPDPS